MKYIREDIEDNWGFLQLQDKILEIMMYIDEFCKNNDIDYCLMGGSALGAKRHGGFIPWDDDLDIFMTPDNYEKFRSLFNKKGDKEQFYLQEWGARDGMVTISKLRMNGTTYIESSLKDKDMHHGIFVDIFILHNCPKSKIAKRWQFLWAKYVITKGLANRGYNRRKGFLGFLVKLLRLFPKNMLIKFGLKQVYKYRNENTDELCNFLGKAVYSNAIYKREWFEPTVYANFEKVQLKIPENLHDFLSFRFGDYMTPPSLDRIKWEQHAESWYVDKDFREVLGREFTFKDEIDLI